MFLTGMVFQTDKHFLHYTVSGMPLVRTRLWNDYTLYLEPDARFSYTRLLQVPYLESHDIADGI